ncbi:MAG: hypothetical protein JWM68_4181 [Verrucomicrobiales bacterium]|nr:hypothetical protein [Verrucomicrobiales bacterium]
MNGDANKDQGIVVEQITRHWWVMALRGLAAILFGVWAFLWPGITLLGLIYLFGAYALVNGLLVVVQGFKAPSGYPRVGSLVIEAIASIAAGVIAFVVPGITAFALLVLIASWAIVNGITEIVAAVRFRKIIKHEWLLVLAGIASLVFGVLMVLLPGAGALAVVWWIGGFAIAFGILLIALAFRMRRGGIEVISVTAAPI